MFEELTNYGSSIAVVDESGSVSYKELYSIGQNILEILEGCQLVLLFPDFSRIFVAIYVALLRTNTPFLLIEEHADWGKFLNLIERYDPDVILINRLENSISGYESKNSFYQYFVLQSTRPNTTQVNPSNSLMLPTSGSTGASNYVRLSSKNIESNTTQIIKSLGISKAHRPLLTMPLNYSYGLSVLNTHLTVGSSITLSPRFVLTKEFWNSVHENNINSFSGVPFFYQNLLRIPTAQFGKNKPKLFTQAGGKLDSNAINRMITMALELDSEFVVMYGQTEATARIAVNRMDELSMRRDSVGHALEGISIEILDSNGESCPIGESGEIRVEGPNISLGYANSRSDLVKGDENQGQLLTGDLGYLDSEGFLFITGRKKRFVKIFGFRYSLDDLESKVKDQVDSIIFIAHQDEIFCISERELTNDEKDQISDKLPRLPTPLKYFSIATFPRLSNGKLDYESIRVLMQ